LLAAGNKKIVATYRHPLWMKVAGWLVVVAMAYMATRGIINLF